MKRIVLDVKFGKSSEPQDIQIFDFSKVDVKKIWTIYDESVLYDLDGVALALDKLEPKHHEGYFIESPIHDYAIRGDKFYYFSHIGEIGASTKILVEYELI